MNHLSFASAMPLIPAWKKPDSRTLTRQISADMRADYTPATLADLRRITETQLAEHQRGEVRPASGVMGHERLAMALGQQNAQVAQFNNLVLLALQARKLASLPTSPERAQRFQAAAQGYAQLLSQLPGGLPVFATQVNSTLTLFRKALDQTLQKSAQA